MNKEDKIDETEKVINDFSRTIQEKCEYIDVDDLNIYLLETCYNSLRCKMPRNEAWKHIVKSINFVCDTVDKKWEDKCDRM